MESGNRNLVKPGSEDASLGTTEGSGEKQFEIHICLQQLRKTTNKLYEAKSSFSSQQLPCHKPDESTRPTYLFP
jgi:hypothetical protein